MGFRDSAAGRWLLGRRGAAWRRRRQYESDLSLTRLEPRRLLNADYSLAADALALDFTDTSATGAVTVSRDGSAYEFRLGAGQWSGPAAPGVVGEGTDTLRVDTAVANPLVGGVRVVDQGDLFVTLEAADFGGLAGGLRLADVAGVRGDSGPFVVPVLAITTTGPAPFSLDALDIDGDLTVTAASSIDENGGAGLLRVTGDLSLAAGVLPGDLNGDGAVTLADYQVWRVDFGAVGGPGDANGDGLTDAADYTVWRGGLGRSVDPGTSSIEVGVALDLRVEGLARLESRGGGDVTAGVLGGTPGALDSGRDVQLAKLHFDTAGDVVIADDSTDGVVLSGVGLRADALSVTSAGAIDSGAVLELRAGEASFESSGPGAGVRVVGEVRLDAASFRTVSGGPGGDAGATLTDQAGGLVLRASDVGGHLAVTTTGGLSDAGVIAVTGDAGFTSVGGDVVLDQLAVGGRVSIDTAGGNATLVGVASLDLGVVSVLGDLSATAAGGGITSAGTIEVAGAAAFSAAVGGVTLTPAGGAARFGTLSLSGAAAVVTESDGTVLAAVDVAQLTLESGGGVTDSPGAWVRVAGDASLRAAGPITLGDQVGDVLDVGGAATFDATAGPAPSSIALGPAGVANFGTLSLLGAAAVVQEDSATVLAGVAVDSLELAAAGLSDATTIVVAGDLTVVTTGALTLANDTGDVLSVGGAASLTAGGDIAVGLGGDANFGTLALDTLSLGVGAASVRESSATELVSVNVGDLVLVSAHLSDTAGAVIYAAGGARLESSGGVVLADAAGDTLTVGGRASLVSGAPGTQVGAGGVANFGAVAAFGGPTTIREASSTVIDSADAQALAITSAGSVTDPAGAAILVGGPLLVVAAGPIVLANSAADTLTAGATQLAATGVLAVGEAGAVSFGVLSLSGTDIRVQEDADTVLAAVSGDTLRLESSGGLTDTGGAIAVAGGAELIAAAAIALADGADETLAVGGPARAVSQSDVSLGAGGVADFGTLEVSGRAIVVREGSATVLAGVEGDSLALASAETITDVAGVAVQVSGDAELAAASGIVLADAAADQLTVGGGASLVVSGAGGDIAVGPAGAANFGRLSLQGDEARVQEDSTTRLDRVAVRRLELSSTGEIGDVANADIDVAQQAVLHATTPFEDIILGDSGAVVRLGEVIVIAAQHASLQLAGGFGLGDVTIDGTLLAAAAAGDIVQTGTQLLAEAIGLRAPLGGVLVFTAATNRFAAEAGGALNIAGRSAALDAVLADLADPRVAPGDDTGLAPTTIAGATLTPLATDSLYGVVLLDHTGDVVVGRVADPTTGAAGEVAGVRSAGGHAFVRTRAAGPGPAAAGDLLLTGAGTQDGRAVLMARDHVFTAVAAGDLRVATATTALVATGASGTGVVNDVSPYASYDDRDGLVGGVVVLPAVAKEGVGLLVTIPSTELDAPTSRLVGAGAINPQTRQPAPNTQFVDLVVGRPGEHNLGVHITFADGTVVAGFQDATTPGGGTPGDLFSHTFAGAFLGDGTSNPSFPDLPTEIAVVSDPRINLYDEGGAQNLNRSITPTNAATPERIDQFVLATTQQLFAFAEEPVPPEARVLFVAAERPTLPAPGVPLLLPDGVDVRIRSALEAEVAIAFGPLDEESAGRGVTKIIDGTAEDWEGGAENYLAAIKQAIRDSDRPAGRYVIRVERVGAPADVTIFVKQSTVGGGEGQAGEPTWDRPVPVAPGGGEAGRDDGAIPPVPAADAPPAEGGANAAPARQADTRAESRAWAEWAQVAKDRELGLHPPATPGRGVPASDAVMLAGVVLAREAALAPASGDAAAPRAAPPGRP